MKDGGIILQQILAHHALAPQIGQPPKTLAHVAQSLPDVFAQCLCPSAPIAPLGELRQAEIQSGNQVSRTQSSPDRSNESRITHVGWGIVQTTIFGVNVAQRHWQ